MNRKILVAVLIFAMLISTTAFAASIDVYFSPNGGVRNAILAELYRAQKTVDVAMYSFTDSELSWALVKLKQKGVKVRVYMDREQAAGKYAKDEFFISKGVPVKIDTHSGIMHNKFAVIDGRVLITGSYNWTASAEEHNAENMLVIREPDVVAIFAKQFERYWANP